MYLTTKNGLPIVIERMKGGCKVIVVGKNGIGYTCAENVSVDAAFELKHNLARREVVFTAPTKAAAETPPWDLRKTADSIAFAGKL